MITVAISPTEDESKPSPIHTGVFPVLNELTSGKCVTEAVSLATVPDVIVVGTKVVKVVEAMDTVEGTEVVMIEEPRVIDVDEGTDDVVEDTENSVELPLFIELAPV